MRIIYWFECQISMRIICWFECQISMRIIYWFECQINDSHGYLTLKSKYVAYESTKCMITMNAIWRFNDCNEGTWSWDQTNHLLIWVSNINENHLLIWVSNINENHLLIWVSNIYENHLLIWVKYQWESFVDLSVKCQWESLVEQNETYFVIPLKKSFSIPRTSS
jgi:hypothetical protein